ncbi:MAG: transcriptional regulator [Acidobacteriaceae bacterium]|jgi:predicted DNA-binding transcriptional regulator YafY|nr:transcriptional regulator [Acidobacteriaceae bacterium]
MPRNAEVIRQWTILRAIERSRLSGVTIDHLATECAVTTRTIRRDLQALEEAGFPVYDDKDHSDGRTRWKINGQAFHGLTAGLTLSELCALYFGRTLLEALAGTPFRDDLEHAFDKLSQSLTPHMRQFLDELPRVIASKPDPLRRTLTDEETARPPIVARALDATLFNRQALVRYHSRSSERTKQYLVHPYRLAYAQGGLYLLAYVPEYEEIRTFAVERIEEISLLEERFTPMEDLPDEAFPHSLGVHSGTPESVVLAFQPGMVDYVKAREWHPSQRYEDLPDGGTRMTLDVCLDHALRSWILSFGPFVHVVSPASLAREIAAQLQAASARYDERIDHRSPAHS